MEGCDENVRKRRRCFCDKSLRRRRRSAFSFALAELSRSRRAPALSPATSEGSPFAQLSTSSPVFLFDTSHRVYVHVFMVI